MIVHGTHNECSVERGWKMSLTMVTL